MRDPNTPLYRERKLVSPPADFCDSCVSCVPAGFLRVRSLRVLRAAGFLPLPLPLCRVWPAVAECSPL